MLAMIAIDKEDGMLFIVYHSVKKLMLVKTDEEAEAFVAKEFDNCVLLGTFPDPTKLVNIVLKERDRAKKTKKASSKG